MRQPEFCLNSTHLALCVVMDMLRDLRRKSLQLERSDVDRFRPANTAAERRGSLAENLAVDKKGNPGGRLHRSLT